MKIEFDYNSTKYDEDITLYITPCVSLFLSRTFTQISFAWLVFSFSMDIIIDK